MRATLLCLLLSAWPAFAGDDELETRCAELSAQLEKLLGPKFEKPVPVKIVDGDFIVKLARMAEAKQMPEELRDLGERLLVRWKLAPEGFDLSEAQFGLLRASVAGLYDPDKDCFYVVGDKVAPGTAEFDVTIAHELAHAYRDVDKDYWKRVLDTILKDEDAAIAVTCLVEGDAMVVGQVVGMGARSDSAIDAVVKASKEMPQFIPQAMANPALRPYPLYLREMLVSRYFIGQAFAARVYEKGGWKALAAAYDDPPRSTEQILHPEKYLGPEVDEPTRIEGGDPAAALGEGWKTVYGNTMGEFLVRVHFTESLGRKAATKVAEGWDGARYHICEKEGAPLFAGLVTVWDSEKDAAEFAGAWAAWAGARDDPEAAEVRAGELRGEARVETKDGLVVVRVAGARVLVADGVPADRADAVLDALAGAKLIP